jgi:hypothetical protein
LLKRLQISSLTIAQYLLKKKGWKPSTPGDLKEFMVINVVNTLSFMTGFNKPVTLV